MCSPQHSLPRPLHGRSPPAASPAARSPPRTVCPACDPRQGAKAFNQPLSWDTSRVTRMGSMFLVRRSPRFAPAISAVAAISPARCVHTVSPAARLSRLPARSPPCTVCPACDPRQGAQAFNQPLSWDISGLMVDMSGIFSVRCSPPPAPQPVQSHASPLHAACTTVAPCTPAGGGSSLAPTPRTPSMRLGSGHLPCPPPTSCTSAARGRTRAPPPSPLLAMAQAVVGDGPREAAPEVLTEACVWPGQSLGGCLYHIARNLRVASTPTPTWREGRTKKTSEQRLRLPDKMCSRVSADLATI